MKEKWFITSKKADFNSVSKKYNISPVTARIIRNRDIITDYEIQKYLYGTIDDLYNPKFLKDIGVGIRIIHEKIMSKKKIRIIGDYDVDGVTSTTILLKGLYLAGAIVDYSIPDRITDGYGLNETLIDDAYKNGIDTIITCDNGIAAVKPINKAVQQYGMTVIITDHHEVPYEENINGKKYILPNDASAIIDPKQPDDSYPFSEICGAVVSYKFVQALLKAMKIETDLTELLEFAALGTVCDVMPLKDENRIIVKYGLQSMNHSKNNGLKALIEINSIAPGALSSYHLGFILGPCVNATGRLETARKAVELFMENDYDKAIEKASYLKTINDDRKDMTLRETEKAIEIVENMDLSINKVLVINLSDCHESLVGIIAGRIKEKYNRPAIVFTKAEDKLKGSGRSIEAYDMFSELSKVKSLFLKMGGHKMAAGMSIDENVFDTLKESLNKSCTLGDESFISKIHIDVPMPISYATEDFINELSILEPFGVGNPKPVFAQKNVQIKNGKVIGKNKNMGKFTVQDESNRNYDMIYFGDIHEFNNYIESKYGTDNMNAIYEGNLKEIILLSAIYYPSINEYMGNKKIQMVMSSYC